MDTIRGSSRVARVLPLAALVLVCAAAIPAFANGSQTLPTEPAPIESRERGFAPDSAAEAANRTATTSESGLPATELDALSATERADTSTGLSGQLRVHILAAGSTPPGVYDVPSGVAGHPFAFLGVVPFAAKHGSWVGTYRVGLWPAELRSVRSGAYDNPTGFIAVTSDNADLQVSAHFRLGDFVTHDLAPFPKYVVLREALLDKLELVLADLSMHGVPTQHVVVLSGFRTPAYNVALGNASGRARESRHQYGDASDVIIDADQDGRMDDLNGDGQVNAQDVRVIEASVNRVEQMHPELAGGLGLYEAMGPSGPFAHIDVRGTRARWGTLGRGARTPSQLASSVVLRAQPAETGHCYAEGASAVLCQGFRHSH